jgi:hypothetical protein
MCELIQAKPFLEVFTLISSSSEPFASLGVVVIMQALRLPFPFFGVQCLLTVLELSLSS